MKAITIPILFFLSLSVLAQEKHDVSKVLLRVYDLQGYKIAKGKLNFITDTTLCLVRQNETVLIPVNTIGSVKVKRSAGFNLLIGSGIGVVVGTGMLIANDNPYLPYSVGTFLGATLGLAIGAITIPFKKSTSYIIYGNKMRLKEFEKIITILN